MNHSTPSDGPHPGSARKRRYLTAGKKFQIYLEAQGSDKPVGELLRREGLYSTDLARIRQRRQFLVAARRRAERPLRAAGSDSGSDDAGDAGGLEHDGQHSRDNEVTLGSDLRKYDRGNSHGGDHL